MSIVDYVESGGDACPHCGGHELAGMGRVEFDTGTAWQKIACENDDCGATWNDIYTLTGYDDLIVPTKS